MRGPIDPGLRRWLWLVKWILVIPHLVVLAFLWDRGGRPHARGGCRDPVHRPDASYPADFNVDYPEHLSRRLVLILIMGLNPVVLPVLAYSALMTDVYPPFRLDTEGDEPTADAAPTQDDSSVAASSAERPRQTAS